MAITFVKWLGGTYQAGSRNRFFVLTDGVTMRKSILGGMSGDNARDQNAVESRLEELFDEGKDWVDPFETTKTKSPTKTNINNASSVPELKAEVSKLWDTVDDLMEKLG